MCTGLEFALLQAGTAVAGTAASVSSQNRAARQSYAASAGNAQRAGVENARLQRSVLSQSVQDMTDRMRQANAELGTINAAAGDAGIAGRSLAALQMEQAYVTGLDLGRIQDAAENQIETIQSQSEAGVAAAADSNRSVYQQTSASNTGAFLSLAGSGLQIASNYRATQQRLDLSRNRQPRG